MSGRSQSQSQSLSSGNSGNSGEKMPTVKSVSALSDEQEMDIDLLNVEIAMEHSGSSPVLLQSGSNLAFQRMCSGIDLDALELMRPASSQSMHDGIGEDIVNFFRTNSSLSGEGKELLDIILNDDSLQGSSATEMIRKASMKSEGGAVICDELLQLSDEQLSQFLRRPADAPGGAVTNQAAAVNHAIPRCPTGHQCVPSVKVDGEYAGGEFACDKCANIRSVTLERWNCAICSVDFCYTCTPAVQSAPISQNVLQLCQSAAGANTVNTSMQWANSGHINKSGGPERQQWPKAEVQQTQRRAKVVYPKGETIHWNRKNTARESSPRSKAAAYTRARSYQDVEDEVDEWEGKRIVMKKGKYQGRGAYVKQRANKKYRVMVDGVEDQLEFYPTSFSHIAPVPPA